MEKTQRKIPESKIQGRIVKELEADGYFVVKLSLTNKNGMPDLMALKDGVAKFIEVKKTDGKVSPLQEYRMKELERFGFKCDIRRE